MNDSIAQIFWIVLPVFGLIGVGFAAAWSRYLPESIGEGLGDFVFMVALPILLFKTLATVHFPDISPWPVWISYFGGVAVCWALSDLMLRKLFGRDAKAGIIAGVSAGFSNAVLLGIPLVFTAFGEQGAVPVLLIVAVQLPVLMTVSTALIEWAEHRDGTATGPISVPRIAGSIALNLVKNPLVIGIVGGSFWRFLGLGYSGPLQVLGDQIAVVAVPCALFALGMSLTKYGVRGHVLPAVFISAFKLLLMPAIVWFLAARVFALPPMWTTVVTLIGACPTGVNAWLIANRFRTGLAISANSITLTSAGSVLTLPFWLWVLGA
ncbi:AEC family transporter [Microbaculum marinisediminis]|uniref:AEC family transporter n=1 Tax=Microbaculum marinisediminis TaxID=2931392 RepID=A0AAW5R622_9HYPH|nr:AEC family transporter [Microbaculum sp. A6E488]MCT8974547.1 AEC family transporter [Microbaculum sp. A6E488]